MERLRGREQARSQGVRRTTPGSKSPLFGFKKPTFGGPAPPQIRSWLRAWALKKGSCPPDIRTLFKVSAPPGGTLWKGGVGGVLPGKDAFLTSQVALFLKGGMPGRQYEVALTKIN